MTHERNPGRVAGLLYLSLVVLGPIRLIYIPNRLLATENPAIIAQNLAAHALLFRIGIASEIVLAVVGVILTLAFYRLFEGVSRFAAALVVLAGGAVPAVIDFFIAAFDLQALEISRGAEFLAAIDKTHQDALVGLLISLGNHSNTAAELLWGAWLFPLGYLVYKSRFLPRFIGVWLFLNGGAYVALCFTGIFAPPYQTRVFNWSTPFTLAEIVLMLWLVIRGARPPVMASAAAH
jgi:hypothetical protein